MNEFLANLKTQRIQILIIISLCVAIALTFGGFYVYIWQKSNAPPSSENVLTEVAPRPIALLTALGSTTPQELTNKIIKRASLPLTLTAGEREIILEQFGGVDSKIWNSLTPTERQAVVNALNK